MHSFFKELLAHIMRLFIIIKKPYSQNYHTMKIFLLLLPVLMVTGCKRDCCDINDDCPPIKQEIRLRVLDKITNEDLIFDGQGNFNAQFLKIFYTSSILSDTVFYPITPRNHPEGYRIATFLIDADTIAFIKFIDQKKIDTLKTIGLWQEIDC